MIDIIPSHSRASGNPLNLALECPHRFPLSPACHLAAAGAGVGMTLKQKLLFLDGINSL